MSDIVIEGVGMHPFGRFGAKPAVEMACEAIVEALQDAQTDWSGIEAIYCAHMYVGTGAGQRICAILGQTGVPVINVENACSSGGAAIALARQALASSEHQTVLAVGLEKMPRGFMDMDYFEPWRQQIGHAVNPAQFAFAIRRHMHEHGITERHLALVAEKNHAHSVHNAKAMYRRRLSVEEILASPMIVDPLRLLMLCAPNEGAAAAVLRRRSARDGEVRLIGQGLKTATREQPLGEHMPTDSPIGAHSVSVTRRAADQAFERAGVGPDDLDLVELQDTDSGTELISMEELGLCERGAAGRLLESGATRLGGRLPINPSGGLLSKGEPVGASGLGQVYEVVNQLRGRCGPRQVTNARLGLAHALGAGGNCSVMVFERC
jgi:acetyl-CoA acetyltransferase